MRSGHGIGVQAQFLPALEKKPTGGWVKPQERRSDFRLICARIKTLRGSEKRDSSPGIYYRICVSRGKKCRTAGPVSKKAARFGDNIAPLLPYECAGDKRGSNSPYSRRYDWLPGNTPGRSLKEGMLSGLLSFSQRRKITEAQFSPGFGAGKNRGAGFSSPAMAPASEGNRKQSTDKGMEQFPGDTKKSEFRALGISRASLYRN